VVAASWPRWPQILAEFWAQHWDLPAPPHPLFSRCADHRGCGVLMLAVELYGFWRLEQLIMVSFSPLPHACVRNVPGTSGWGAVAHGVLVPKIQFRQHLHQ